MLNLAREPLEAWCVAIIDDSPDDRAELRRMLLTGSERRLTFIEAETGAAGIAAVLSASPPPDCILLDYNLPDMAGPDVLTALMGKDGMPVCPVVVVTGGGNRDDARRVLRGGAQDYVGKDWITAQGISRAIENAAESFAMARELRERKETLRRVTDREAFRNAFGEATRTLVDPQALKTVSSRLLGIYLQASRVVYAKVSGEGQVVIEPGYVNGVAQIEGVFALADYGDKLLGKLRAGENIIAHDLPNDPAYTTDERAAYAQVEVVANLGIPITKEGRLLAILGVHQNEPRHWHPEEIAIATEIAERIWSSVERVRYEKKLAASEVHLSQMIEIMPSFSAVLRGPEHVVERANAAFYDITQRGPEILEKPYALAFPEFASQAFPALLDKVYQTGETFEAKGMRAFVRSGHGDRLIEVFVDFAYLPLRGVDGEVSGIFIQGADRTAEVKALEDLSRRERQLRSLADNTPDVLTRFDRDLRHVFVNAVIEQITGRKVEDLLGKTNRELGMPAHLCDQWDAAINHVIDQGTPASLEFEWETPNDGMRHYSCRLVPELNDQGGVDSVLGVTHDITHRKAFERQLSEQGIRKDEFLATLAHELRNPLAPLRTGLEVIKLAPGSAAAARALPVMERQLSHMVRLIDDLLDVSRINNGKIVLRLERVSLQDVAASAVEASRSLIDVAGHTLTVALPDEPVWLDADPTRLSQILSNLLNNSAKYTAAGGQIRLDARCQAGKVRVCVTDNGMGIPPDMLQTVFEMFTQIDRTLDQAGGGLGLGLSLVKKLTELHGGDIQAASAGIDRGSEFTVTLPVADPPVAVDVPAAIPRAAPPLAAGRRVLVIDDNRDAAETMAMLLELSGYETRAAFEGHSALAMALDFRPELIFVDIGLPGMNGYQIAETLRAHPSTAGSRLVALTGWGTADDRKKSKSAGFDAHLTKPVEPGQIDEILASLLPTG